MLNSSPSCELKIHGTHCASCEVLIERRLRALPGVRRVKVNYADGRAVVESAQPLSLDAVNLAIRADGYRASLWSSASAQPRGARHYVEVGAIFLVLYALAHMLGQFKLLPAGLGVSTSMGLGTVFLIGLVAAVSSCIAVTGGLLLAVAAKHQERHPQATGAQRFRPHLYFNLGRIIGYTAFGAAVGALGSLVALSPQLNGVVMVVASLLMVLLGLQLLHLFPRVSRLRLVPKWLAHRIHAVSNSDRPAAPFLLGAATFFLPCGFTQALQFYVLTTGSAARGALVMLVFSLATLPALLAVGAVSSFARGAVQRYVLKFSGALVVMLGVANIGNGATLAGWSLGPVATQAVSVRADPNVTLENGVQVVRTRVDSRGYTPSHVTLRQGVPVRWEIDGVNTYGCQSVILVPRLGLTTVVAPGPNVVEFTPNVSGEVPFHCSMGMFRGSFTVVASGEPAAAPRVPTPACDPTIANCLPAATSQRIRMEVSRERGFYPPVLYARAGDPIELTVDDQVPLGGCMGVMVIPRLRVAKPLALGTNTLRFTAPTAGAYPITCSMGTHLATLVVTED